MRLTDKLKKGCGVMRTGADLFFPLIGEFDVYYKKRKSENMSRKEALYGMGPGICAKVFSLAVYLV